MVSPLELLAAAASADGGWGYRPDQPAHVEPTCFAVLALAAKLDHAAAVARGLEAVEAHAHADGSYRLARGRPQAVWPTAQVLFAKAVLARPFGTTAVKLLEIEAKVVRTEQSDAGDIDAGLLGWPWAEETFNRAAAAALPARGGAGRTRRRGG